MPNIGGVYVAPTWNDDAPPAIDAHELQDICDAVENHASEQPSYGKGTPSLFGHVKLTDAPDPQADAAAGVAASGAAVAEVKSNTAFKTVTGTYTGTGRSGIGQANTLTFEAGHVPTKIIIKDVAMEYAALVLYPQAEIGLYIVGRETHETDMGIDWVHVSATQTTASWYHPLSNLKQCNVAGKIYRYYGMY